MKYKRAMSAVVATALILVVAVVATIGFQTWFSDYQSQVLSDTEQKSSSSNSLKIQGVSGDNLYLYSGSDNNLSSLKIVSDTGTEMCSFADSSEVNSSGLVGWWKLDDESATITDYSGNGNDGKLYGNTRLLLDFDDGTADDETSYGNNGTINGAIWTDAGCISGGCFEFDGVDDYIKADTIAALTSNFSISFWMKVSSIQTGAYDPVSFGHNSTNGFVIQGFDGDLDLIAGPNPLYSAPLGDLRDDLWRHFIVIMDQELGSKVYIDGELNVSNLLMKEIKYIDSPEINLGRDPLSGRYFNGSIDEVAIYSKALTETEVKNLYNSQKAKFVEFKNSKLDKAVEFDGLDDYIDLGLNGIADPQNNLNGTIVTISKGNIGSIYSEQELTPSATLILSALNNNFNIHNGVSFDSASISSISSSNWNFISGKWNLTDLVFISNADVNSVSYGGSSQTFQSPLIGAYYSGFLMTQFFDGQIDEVRIYNRTLSQEEIESLYWDFLSSNEQGINKIDISSCNLNQGEKYNIVAFTDSQKAESYFIVK